MYLDEGESFQAAVHRTKERDDAYNLSDHPGQGFS